MQKKTSYAVFFMFAYIIMSLLITLSITKIEEKSVDIICIMKVNDQKNGFWKTLSDGAKMAAKEYGANIKIIGPNEETDIEFQNKLIKESISKKPDVIILAAADNEKTLPMALKIKESGINLIIVDSGLKKNIEDTYIATDNYKAGLCIGRMLEKYIKEGDKVGIVNFVENSKPAIERELGVREAFEKNNNTVLNTIYCDSNPDIAKELTIKMIKDNPDISAIAALNQYSTEGAARAVRELGFKDKIKIVGMDNSKEQIQYLEDETIAGLVVQKPLNMGYLSVEKAVELLSDKTIPDKIDSGLLMVTKDNMYTGMYQKVLFPFMEND